MVVVFLVLRFELPHVILEFSGRNLHVCFQRGFDKVRRGPTET